MFVVKVVAARDIWNTVRAERDVIESVIRTLCGQQYPKSDFDFLFECMNDATSCGLRPHDASVRITVTSHLKYNVYADQLRDRLLHFTSLRGASFHIHLDGNYDGKVEYSHSRHTVDHDSP